MKFSLTIAVLAALLFPYLVNAESLFKNCDTIATDTSYGPLQKYFLARDESIHLCQRLDDSEFLYTSNDNFYYCKPDKGAFLQCEPNERGVFFPDLSLVKKYTGENGGPFVLFRSRRISGEEYKESYYAFYPVPKNIAPRGYVLYLFPDAGSADRNEGSGKCVNKTDTEVVTMSNPAAEVFTDSKFNVTVRFNQLRTNCKTNKKAKQTLEYVWQKNNFHQSGNLIVSLPRW